MERIDDSHASQGSGRGHLRRGRRRVQEPEVAHGYKEAVFSGLGQLHMNSQQW